MPSFAEVWAAFAAAVVDPDVSAPEGIFVGPESQRQERFGIYRNNVVSGLIEQLAGSFPVVRRLTGDAFFRAMARAFILSRPPRSPVLMRYGDEFGAFIDQFRPASTLPYLADVATLEALRVRAYHAADAKPLTTPEAMVHLAEAGLGALQPHPSASLLRSRFPVLTIWLANQPNAAPGRIRIVDGENVLIVRPAMTVNAHLIDASAADAFEALCSHDAGRAEWTDGPAAIGELTALGALVSSQQEERR